MSDKDNKTSLNLDESIARPMCYIPVLGVLISVVFLVLEKHPKVKWDAAQAVLLWLTIVILGGMLEITIVGRKLIPLVNLVGMIVLPLVLAIKANKKEDTRIPVLAELASAILEKIHGKAK